MSDSKGVGGMLKLGVILALYAAAACVGLAFVYTGTKGIIEKRAADDQEAALKELFSEADSFQPIAGGLQSPDPQVTITNPQAALKGGRVLGAALQTSRASYSGDTKILVGVDVEGRVKGIKILENTDTPGLGANAASASYYVDRAAGLHFYDQFTGKSVSDAFEPKDDVTAITAATITSKAVSASVKAAGLAASEWLETQGSKGGSK